MQNAHKLSLSNLLKATKFITFSSRLSQRHLFFSKNMEGYIVTTSGEKRSIVSPDKFSPRKRTNFVGISPQKELTNIVKPTDRTFRVSIEGNIGAGKSTLIDYFAKFPGIETYPEPIEWWRNVGGHNLLDLLYAEPNKFYTTFQMYVQLTRLQIQTSQPKSPSTTVQMFERSIQNNRYCFVERGFKNGTLNEVDFCIIKDWYKWAQSNCDIDLDLIVYLRSTPEVVYERMKQRKRPEETGVKFEYLEQLHESHENWLMTDDQTINTIPVLVLDADKALEEIIEQYKSNTTRILGHNDMTTQALQTSQLQNVKKVLKLDS